MRGAAVFESHDGDGKQMGNLRKMTRDVAARMRRAVTCAGRRDEMTKHLSGCGRNFARKSFPWNVRNAFAVSLMGFALVSGESRGDEVPRLPSLGDDVISSEAFSTSYSWCKFIRPKGRAHRSAAHDRLLLTRKSGEFISIISNLSDDELENIVMYALKSDKSERIYFDYDEYNKVRHWLYVDTYDEYVQKRNSLYRSAALMLIKINGRDFERDISVLRGVGILAVFKYFQDIKKTSNCNVSALFPISVYRSYYNFDQKVLEGGMVHNDIKIIHELVHKLK